MLEGTSVAPVLENSFEELISQWMKKFSNILISPKFPVCSLKAYGIHFLTVNNTNVYSDELHKKSKEDKVGNSFFPNP